MRRKGEGGGRRVTGAPAAAAARALARAAMSGRPFPDRRREKAAPAYTSRSPCHLSAPRLGALGGLCRIELGARESPRRPCRGLAGHWRPPPCAALGRPRRLRRWPPAVSSASRPDSPPPSRGTVPAPLRFRPRPYDCVPVPLAGRSSLGQSPCRRSKAASNQSPLTPVRTLRILKT